MAHMAFRRIVFKSGGTQARARLAYLTRTTAREGLEDLVYVQSRNLPGWAEGNPQTYFRTAEQYERLNGNAFEEWKVTLPQELSLRQNMDLMRDLVQVIAGDRLPITYAFHCPRTMDGRQPQPHLHLLLSGRQNDGIPRTPAGYFGRVNRHAPQRGGATKDPALYHRGAVKAWRVTISDVINVHLEQAGLAVRVHPARLADRGIPRQPEPKLWPSESAAYRATGYVSPVMARVQAVRAERRQTRAREQAEARDYWAVRKERLGITPGMDVPTCLARIGQARAVVRDAGLRRGRAEGYAGVEQDDRTLGDQVGEGFRAVPVAQALTGLGHHLDALRQEDGHGQAGQVVVRLWEREPERGMGM